MAKINLFSRFNRKRSDGLSRVLGCFSCANETEVFPHAFSMICPACGSSIDLDSYWIDSPESMSIATHGNVCIGSSGVYAGGKIRAGQIEVEGSLDAIFECRKLILAKSGKVSALGEADFLEVSPDAEVVLERPIVVKNAKVAGSIVVPFLEVKGFLVIKSGGSFRGKVKAGSMRVDKGGKFDGFVESTGKL